MLFSLNLLDGHKKIILCFEILYFTGRKRIKEYARETNYGKTMLSNITINIYIRGYIDMGKFVVNLA